MEKIYQSIGQLQSATDEHSNQINGLSERIEGGFTRIHARIDDLVAIEQSSNSIAKGNAEKIEMLSADHKALSNKVAAAKTEIEQARGGLSMLRWIFGIVIGSGAVAAAIKFFGGK